MPENKIISNIKPINDALESTLSGLSRKQMTTANAFTSINAIVSRITSIATLSLTADDDYIKPLYEAVNKLNHANSSLIIRDKKEAAGYVKEAIEILQSIQPHKYDKNGSNLLYSAMERIKNRINCCIADGFAEGYLEKAAEAAIRGDYNTVEAYISAAEQAVERLTESIAGSMSYAIGIAHAIGENSTASKLEDVQTMLCGIRTNMYELIESVSEELDRGKPKKVINAINDMQDWLKTLDEKFDSIKQYAQKVLWKAI